MKYFSSGKYQEFICDTGYTLSSVAKYNYNNFVKANENQQPKNVKLFADTLPKRFQDERTYFPDPYWVTYWAEPLNSQYRENNLSFEKFLETYTDGTNAELRKLKEELGLI